MSPVPGAAAAFHVPRPGLAVSRACELWGERWVSGSGQPGGDFGGEGALVTRRGEGGVLPHGSCDGDGNNKNNKELWPRTFSPCRQPSLFFPCPSTKG